MTALVEVEDWRDRAAALAGELAAAGKLVSPEWRTAMEAVPRHVFVPSFFIHRKSGMAEVSATNRTRGEWRPSTPTPRW